jgi:hypothetical protein
MLPAGTEAATPIPSATGTLAPGGEGDQCYVPGSLEFGRQLSLVPCAVARNTPGYDLASFSNKHLEQLDVLVIVRQRTVLAELACFALVKSFSSGALHDMYLPDFR